MEGQASGGRIIWLHAHSPPPTHRRTEKERKLVDGSGKVEEGEGDEPNHTSLVLYKSFNTLCMVSCMRDINVERENTRNGDQD
jgi:hypothetical protein